MTEFHPHDFLMSRCWFQVKLPLPCLAVESPDDSTEFFALKSVCVEAVNDQARCDGRDAGVRVAPERHCCRDAFLRGSVANSQCAWAREITLSRSSWRRKPLVMRSEA